MTHVVMSNLTKMRGHWLITGGIGPRPIGLVTACRADAPCNAARYGSFTCICEDPLPIAVDSGSLQRGEHRSGGVRTVRTFSIAEKSW
jgi:flavin reductase (DIM6/NTAB) family NADH-FMN oxidoreductase RutF